MDSKLKIPFGYSVLRPLSFSSPLYIGREHASERLVVLKFFLKNEMKRFQEQAKILTELETYSGSPLLYFANELHPVTEIPSKDDFSYCLGTQYISGKSLQELVEENTLPKACPDLEQQLRALFKLLHEKYGRNHGDLSPKNILVKSSDGRVAMIDWEFSESLNEPTLNSYAAYRGTPGFSPQNDQISLADKDWLALDACLKYCGVLDQGHEWKHWFKKKKNNERP